ncbi:hypothetical protein ADUPG1_003783, partial [Aduncisulcus paluster]
MTLTYRVSCLISMIVPIFFSLLSSSSNKGPFVQGICLSELFFTSTP